MKQLRTPHFNEGSGDPEESPLSQIQKGDMVVSQKSVAILPLTPMSTYPRVPGSGRLVPSLGRGFAEVSCYKAPTFAGDAVAQAQRPLALLQPLRHPLLPRQPLHVQLEASTFTSKAERVADGDIFCYQSRLINSRCLQRLSTTTNKALCSITSAPWF